MVELRFNIKDLFTQPIEKIDYNFLPKTFRGDRRQVADATTKFADIVNQLGELSAKTQGLARPVTTSQKLRQSENQYVYILADVNAGRNGALIGMLKVGKKNLYIYNGYESIPINTPTILDFYVHEDYRRNGYGKQIFDRMLHEEGWLPHKCAVDRPSDKLMGFLKKHYGLQRIIPQVNDIVVYEGFFDDGQNHQNSYAGPHITDSPNTALFGPQYTSDDTKRQQKLADALSSPGLPKIENSQIGRYAAARPVCSMAECLKSPDGEQFLPSQQRIMPKAIEQQSQEMSQKGHHPPLLAQYTPEMMAQFQSEGTHRQPQSLMQQYAQQAFAHQPQMMTHQTHIITHQPQMITHQPQMITHQPQMIAHQPQIIAHQPQMTQHNPQMTQHNPQVTQHNPQMTQQHPQMTQHHPQLTQQNSQMTQQNAQMTQQNPQMVQQNPQMIQQNHQMAQQYAQMPQQHAQMSQQHAQMSQQNAQMAPKNAQMAPKNAQMTQQNAQMTQQNPQMTQQNPQMTQQNPQMTQQNPQMTQQTMPQHPQLTQQQQQSIPQQQVYVDPTSGQRLIKAPNQPQLEENICGACQEKRELPVLYYQAQPPAMAQSNGIPLNQENSAARKLDPLMPTPTRKENEEVSTRDLSKKRLALQRSGLQGNTMENFIASNTSIQTGGMRMRMRGGRDVIDEVPEARYNQLVQEAQGTPPIIHNSATKARGEPNSTVECSPADENPEETEAISVQVQNIHIDEPPTQQQTNGHTQEEQLEPVEESLIEKIDNNTEESGESEHIPRPIFLNKQHTGLKNISYNVGMAVSPTAKMDFGPDKIKAGSKLSPVPGQDNTDAESHVSSEGYTDQGYLDLKFYHNRLW